MKFKVGTTAYQRKTKTQRDIIVTIFIDETALARVLGERAINNRSKESKVLRGIMRGGVHILLGRSQRPVFALESDGISHTGERWDLTGEW